jgi:acetyl esterase
MTTSFRAADRQSTIDPQLDKLLRAAATAGRVPPSRTTPEHARAQLAARAAAGPPGRRVAEVRERTVPGPGGEIPLRIYTPGEEHGTVVYLHGGGWVLGDLDTSDAVCRELAMLSGARVVSVGYRLAPENPYPAGLSDAWTALRWAAAEFDGPLAIFGDSAGGNLAAVCAHRARRTGAVRIDLQVLAYPVLDADFTRGSHRSNTREDFLLNTKELRWFWDQYLPERDARGDPEAAPLREPDCAGLPATILLIAKHDPLRDENLDYAQRLRAAGVPVATLHYPRMTHGFLSLLGAVDETQRAWVALGGRIRQALAHR